MNQTPDDLDRRLAVQTERSKLRHVEMMGWVDQRHQQEKRRRQRYERFKWLYWGAGGLAVTSFIMICIGWGWIVGDLIGSHLAASGQPKMVIVRMQSATTPQPSGTQP